MSFCRNSWKNLAGVPTKISEGIKTVPITLGTSEKKLREISGGILIEIPGNIRGGSPGVLESLWKYLEELLYKSPKKKTFRKSWGRDRDHL